MIKLGITGGIGTGKSVVSKILTTLGIPVFNSDLVSKQILLGSAKVKDLLILKFGNTILDEKNFIDRKKLGSLVFTNNEALKYLEGILHPEVSLAFKEWCKKNEHNPIIGKEAAILIESGTYLELDYILSVNADIQTRIKRIQERDHLSSQEIEQRITKQLPMEAVNNKSHFIINNSGKVAVIPQIMSLLDILYGLSEGE